MKEMYAFMRIIGKTTEESHLFLTIQKICVKTGIPKGLLHLTKMDAKMNTGANLVMVGKNKNSTLTILRSNNACTGILAKSLTVLIITQTLTGNFL